MFITILAQKSSRFYFGGLIVSLLLLAFFTGVDSGVLFRASTLNSITHAPFDGTTYPFSKSMDWVNMTPEEREMSFDQIPDSKKIAPLAYIPSNLSRDFASLGFNEQDKQVRNQKITYTVPYLGNYSLNGKENVGSHAAVDIVMPNGTPVIAIANGIVTQVKDQTYGFGKSIVVMHRGVPNPSGSGTTTLYSSYSHLGEIDVEEFQVVKRGDVIAYSGRTGNASVAHTHFQVDREEAPWYPYWPFTVADQNAAGYDFSTAIDKGLGMDNALKYTVHPLEFVQDHLAMNESSSSNSNSEGEIAGETASTDTAESDVVSSRLPKVEVYVANQMIVGKKYEIKVVTDDAGNSYIANSVTVKPSLLASYTLPDTSALDSEFVIPFEPKESGTLNIEINLGDISASVNDINVRMFKDIATSDESIKSIGYLKNKGIIKGYSDDTFRPDNLVARAEAVKVLTLALPESTVDLTNANCTDTPTDSWFRDYFEKAFDLGAVNPQNSLCRPLDMVTGYEYLKMLLSQSDLDPEVDDKYSSYFDINEWYAPYLQEAVERGIMSASDAAQYSGSLSRREVADITYKFLNAVEGKQDLFR